MIFLFILITYSVLLIGLSIYLSRKVSASGDFFVAGRGLSAGLLFSTLLAANIGAGSTVGATGLGYRDGLSAFWWVGSAAIGSFILAFTVGPKIWKVARDNNLYTVGDYLEFRFSKSVRGIIAVLLWVGSLAILAGQLIAIERILSQTVGTNRFIGCSIGAIAVTTYFTIGGLHSTARVNAIQLFVKMFGFMIAFIFLVNLSGGFAGINNIGNKIATTSNHAGYFNIFGNNIDDSIQYIFLLTPSFIISPGLLQKVFGARDVASVKRGVAFNALGLLLFAAIPPLLGIITRYNFPDLAKPDAALPVMLTGLLPLWLGGLLLAAVFSAELSAADAVLFMLSTSLSKDLYSSYINKHVDDKRLLLVTRITAVICGISGGFIAYMLDSVIGALTIFYSLMTCALFIPLLAGLYTSSVTARTAISSILAAVSTYLYLFNYVVGKSLMGMPAIVWSLLAGLMVILINSIWRVIYSDRQVA